MCMDVDEEWIGPEDKCTPTLLRGIVVGNTHGNPWLLLWENDLPTANSPKVCNTSLSFARILVAASNTSSCGWENYISRLWYWRYWNNCPPSRAGGCGVEALLSSHFEWLPLRVPVEGRQWMKVSLTSLWGETTITLLRTIGPSSSSPALHLKVY